ncbi:polyprenyl synthetase family protein [Streptomyces sp. NPDC058486]|uniref:polyprenyl synthetase family protein n=1 Tax=unclassified Streptomyces TaxID=2593676 RepID=UPI003662E02F
MKANTEWGPADPVTEHLNAFRHNVDAHLRGFLTARPEIRHPTLAPLVDEVIQFVLEGGKRLRPAMCHAGYLAAGGDRPDNCLPAAASLELWHAAMLIHDDIADASDTRRGRPTLHRAYEAAHRAQGWAGDAARHGMGTAILAGDLCLLWSTELLHATTATDDRLHEAALLAQEMRGEVVKGQLLDLLEQANPRNTEGALEVIHYKTAMYTVERPLRLGAALAGASPSVQRAFSRIGTSLGMAFQLRDDLLGTFGHPDTTGKSNLDDLRDGKATVLIAHARNAANTAQHRHLDTLLGNPDLTEEQAGVLRTILDETGARTFGETLLADYTTQARQALGNSSLHPFGAELLNRLVDQCVSRLG